MEQIAKEAKIFKPVHSELRESMNKVLKFISIVILPIGIALFCKQYFVSDMGYESAVLDTVSAMLGMIPQGLVLLISTALALGVIRLSMRKTLVQELYCIETLARVDTLCLDKTGTITEGRMKVEGVQNLTKEGGTARAVRRILGASDDENDTSRALKEAFEPEKTASCSHVIPFPPTGNIAALPLKTRVPTIWAPIHFCFPNRKTP